MPRARRPHNLAPYGIFQSQEAPSDAWLDEPAVTPGLAAEPAAKKKRERPEDVFHVALAKELRWAIAPPRCCNADGVLWFTIEQATGRKTASKDKRGRSFDVVGNRNKAKGVRSGVPDIFVCHAGRAFWLELKAGKNNTSDNQDEMHDALRRAGSNVAVCWTIDEALNALRGWGVPLRIAA